ncbi:cation diffusion facilitator family transporter [Hyphomicrobium sp. CS1BSMeth3]|uniref:cation diffusion facilitator family transporter n=1 Tax=Hyphomicrobium sp. CS1BSMeth3 TaxID=1892844 RepID=UPI00093161E0|nr:cation diffusion facilitator family transporter [Hyphomicrobium sp. CS1BSMeth3]
MPTVEARTHKMAIASIAVACAVLGIKYVAYWVTGSVALFSDALESIVNVVTALVALMAVRISARPADRRHQFGHHKAEYFSAVIEGVLIILAALMILHAAWQALREPRAFTEPWLGLAISGVATVLNAGWSWALITYGRRWRSPALVADGWHLFSDVATSIGVIVGLILAIVTGWQVLDSALAALVAVNILVAGWRVMRSSISGLMDEAVDGDIGRRIRAVISESAAGAIEAHDIRTRTAGRATFIDFHLVVPGAMSVADAHRICDRIEQALEAEIEGAEIVIHVEPEGEARHRGVVVI